ncbi:MAG: Flp family type IVb pilin [Isosphaerales bacterium]
MAASHGCSLETTSVFFLFSRPSPLVKGVRNKAESQNQFDLSLPPLFGEHNVSLALRSISRFLVSEDGPTAVEYAVMLSLIVIACVAVVTSLGQSISGTFSSVSSTLGAGS